MKKSRHWLWFLFAIPIALGIARLHFDVEVLNLLPADLPVVQGLKLYQQNFANSRELIVTVEGSSAEKTEAVARALARILRPQTNLVSSVVWQPGWLEQPALAAELIGYLWLNQPPEVFGELTNRLGHAGIEATLAEAREQLATSMSPMDLVRRGYDPYNLMQLPESVSNAGASFGDGQNLFSSPDGTFRIVFAQSKLDLKNYRACLAWLREIKGLIGSARDRGELSSEIKTGFTGSPAFVAEISSGMEKDMTGSVALTSVIIAILFWLAHRRLVPMLWLLTLLALILGATLAFGGLIFGTVNVVSLGFAAILLGLAVDYAVVHYQEALTHPEAIIPEIRRAIGPIIFWAAFTTISAFLVLNFGGLPGLAQLGSLVALGVALSALVMLFGFLPPLFRDRLKKRQDKIADAHPALRTEASPDLRLPSRKKRLVLASSIGLTMATLGILSAGFPKMDHTADALRPQNSPAYRALDQMKKHLAGSREPLWLVAAGRDEQELGRQLQKASVVLEAAVSNKFIESFTLPTALWPNAEFQQSNRGAARMLIGREELLRQAALGHGFSSNSFVMTEGILKAWRAAGDVSGVFWPTNELSRWIVSKVAAHSEGKIMAVGFAFPATNHPAVSREVANWARPLAEAGFVVSGWEILGSSIFDRVRENMPRVLAPTVFLVLLSLWLAFHRWREILLSLAVLILSGLCLLSVMRLAGWSWNLLNLMALPLMLGAGIDYSIFMQLALRRHHGDLRSAHRSVGRALLLCGGTAVGGFGSLSLSTNAGMASLGQVCAIGIGGNMLISVYLLPIWWRLAAGKPDALSR